MRANRKIIVIGLCAFLLLYCAPNVSWAFWGTDPGGGGGLPPWGLAISEDAPGHKLVGVLIIEYINLNEEGEADYAEMARVVLRLRKGNNLKIFYDEVPGPLSPITDPLGTQMLIMGKMMDTVVDAFFPGSTAEAKVKTLTNYTNIYGNAFLPRDNIEPAYGTCEVVEVLKCWEGHPACDPGDPSNWLEILSCDGDYEFCSNGIDDDGDLKLDGTGYSILWDTDCNNQSGFTVTDIDISVK